MIVKLTLKDCGTGAGGFQPGNTCGSGGGGGGRSSAGGGRVITPASLVRDREDRSHALDEFMGDMEEKVMMASGSAKDAIGSIRANPDRSNPAWAALETANSKLDSLNARTGAAIARARVGHHYTVELTNSRSAGAKPFVMHMHYNTQRNAEQLREDVVPALEGWMQRQNPVDRAQWGSYKVIDGDKVVDVWGGSVTLRDD